ncbi:hypothetical protein LCGC14_3144730, partial [marine sediment metagenome]
PEPIRTRADNVFIRKQLANTTTNDGSSRNEADTYREYSDKTRE